ncbi:hypothetical protein BDY24DRAFT_145784 [Mrakia frigida]|uniref:uncharacterized protein n=1 Tax=Mrakia frigida TaxID=29902 RepID=UPI003FCBF598
MLALTFLSSTLALATASSAHLDARVHKRADVSATPTANGFIQTTPATQANGATIPALTEITANAPTQTTVALFSTVAAGASGPFPSAPVIPSFVLANGNYPALDVVPAVNSTEVQQWLSEIDLSGVPDLNVTTGDCSTSAEAAADASRCWWTCGQCTRDTDITVCPDKLTFGLSFDDGPSPYTPLLLDYLTASDVKATFFVVGSRVISRPEMLALEYELGHQISVHTWSHPPLTTMTNAQIVAELGWTKKAIKDVIGVTPNTMRPPYGDIDDRVRAVCKAMGLTPIIWTGLADGTNFDTDDWRIAGGTATGQSSVAAFDKIMDDVKELDTGFICLEHDLYQQSVDLAVGYILPSVMNSTSPALTLKSIIDCQGKALADAYIETNTNSTATNSSGATTNSNSTAAASAGVGASATVSGTVTIAAGGSTSTSTSAASTGGAGKKMVVGSTVGLVGVVAAFAAAW